MQQGWFQVLGIALDFVGVMLLAYEWIVNFIAQRREERLLSKGHKHIKDHAIAEASGVDGEQLAHYKYLALQAQEDLLKENNEIVKKDNKIRLPVFVTGMGLIAVGFLLQAIGSWPGGMPLLRWVAN